MLDGLDAVPWGSLNHAYGPASDTPRWIRALASTEASRREKGLDELWGSIWHQGTIYEATSRAVPFLIGLVGDPEIQGRVEILQLLEAIARGTSYHQVHGSRGLRDGADFESVLAKELADVEAVQSRLSEGCDVLLSLLDRDPDVALRAHVLWVLARAACARAPHVTQELLRRRPALAVPLLRATLDFALAILDHASAAPLLLEDLGAAEPIVRVSAAVAIGKHGAGELPSRASEVLLAHLDEGVVPGAKAFLFGADLLEDLGPALRRTAPELRERAARALLLALGAKRISRVHEALLDLTFGAEAPPKAWSLEALTALQRQALLTVAEAAWWRSGAYWSASAGVEAILRSRGLEQLGRTLVGFPGIERRSGGR